MDAIQQVKQHAERGGVSVHYLFVKAGVSYSNWGRWHRGETEASTRILKKLLAVPTGNVAKRGKA